MFVSKWSIEHLGGWGSRNKKKYRGGLHTEVCRRADRGREWLPSATTHPSLRPHSLKFTPIQALPLTRSQIQINPFIIATSPIPFPSISTQTTTTNLYYNTNEKHLPSSTIRRHYNA